MTGQPTIVRAADNGPPLGGEAPALTAADRDLIGRARVLAGLRGDALREHARVNDPAMAMAAALGEAQHMLRELAGLAERLGGTS